LHDGRRECDLGGEERRARERAPLGDAAVGEDAQQVERRGEQDGTHLVTIGVRVRVKVRVRVRGTLALTLTP